MNMPSATEMFHINMQGVMTQILGGFQILRILMLASSSACIAPARAKGRLVPEVRYAWFMDNITSTIWVALRRTWIGSHRHHFGHGSRSLTELSKAWPLPGLCAPDAAHVHAAGSQSLSLAGTYNRTLRYACLGVSLFGTIMSTDEAGAGRCVHSGWTCQV